MPALPRLVRSSLAAAASVFLFSFAAMSAAAELPTIDQLPSSAELPDPLRMLDGRPVTTRGQWFAERRPELKTLFEHYMYGRAPAVPGNLRVRAEREDEHYFGGKATKKELALEYGPPGTPPIHLLLVVPNRRQGPAPVFVGLNFCGNHMLLGDPTIGLPSIWMPEHCPSCTGNRAQEAGRGKQVDVWAIEQSIDRGYAVATAYSGDLDPDKPDFADGVHPHFLKPGQTVPAADEWGCIAAWAWGLSRMVDYLVTDSDLDPKRIAVVGHSRLGKTALLAAAFDERIALAIPHQAGCGGTAPSRGQVGESVQQINDRFPHWFCGNFKQFNARVDKLPFDQHCLAALVAPRPLLFTNAVEDQWANPDGQFAVLLAAEPVYELLGAGGLEDRDMPAVGRLSPGVLGYQIRAGKHSMTREDWQVFLDYADRRLGKQP
jgi:hypothetical protein